MGMLNKAFLQFFVKISNDFLKFCCDFPVLNFYRIVSKFNSPKKLVKTKFKIFFHCITHFFMINTKYKPWIFGPIPIIIDGATKKILSRKGVTQVKY